MISEQKKPIFKIDNINYTNKKIQEVKVGDYVLSYNIKTSKDVINEVLYTHLPIVEVDRQIKLHCSNGTTIVTSTSHPMLCKIGNEFDYKPTGEIVIDDVLKSYQKPHETIVEKIELGKEVNVDEQFYDITVDNDNNYYAGDDENMCVIHNSSTTYFPFWHREIQDILVLKNNKGTDDNRVRKMDYGIQFSRLFYKRFISNEDLTLFSPGDCPDLTEAFGKDNDLFDDLYEKYERKTSIVKKKVKARDLMNQFIQERIGTGRMYVMNIDNANEHSSFKDKIWMSNLCLKGDSKINIRVDLEDISNKYNLTKKEEYYYGKLDIKDVVDIFNSIYIESYRFNDQVVMRSHGKIEVLSMDTKTKNREYKSVVKAAMTGENEDVLEIYDDINDIRLVCTPKHPIYTENRGYVEAKDLKEDDILSVINKLQMV